MKFTEQEQRTILAVLDGVLQLQYKEKNNIIGSLTIPEAERLYCKMRYAPYCERHGIEYEDMTEEDYEDAWREEWDS